MTPNIDVYPINLFITIDFRWVFSTLTAGLKAGHQLYNPALSPTARLVPGATWDITYADGSGSGGVVYKDVVSIGTAVSVNQAVEPAVVVSPEFAVNPFSSGLLGLAFSDLNTGKLTIWLLFNRSPITISCC